MKPTQLEYELIALFKSLEDEKDEIANIKQIKESKYDKECKMYIVNYYIERENKEIPCTMTYLKWQIEKDGISYLLAKAINKNPLKLWIDYHIHYKIFYKMECYRDYGYSWWEILLGIADKKSKCLAKNTNG